MAERRRGRLQNLGIVGITALSGFITVALVVGALVVGLWIDAQLGVRGPATICLLVASVPLSLTLMIWLTLTLVKRLPPPQLPNE
jgi:MFS family permease